MTVSLIHSDALNHQLEEWEFAEISPQLDLTVEATRRLAHWKQTRVPTTIGRLLSEGPFAHLGRESAKDWDNRRFLFRCRFSWSSGAQSARVVMDGLATHCDVWLNGVLQLTAKNMFRSYNIELTAADDQGLHELVLDFRPLSELLKAKRPRPRWKSRLVTEQNLRWVRTTFLGRMPGWSPGGGPVGPFRAVRIEAQSSMVLTKAKVCALLLDTQPDDETKTGRIKLDVCVSTPILTKAVFILRTVDQHEVSRSTLAVSPNFQQTHTFAEEIEIKDIEPWWPHTHGKPTLYHYELQLESGDDLVCQTGTLGFRSLTFGTVDSPRIAVNGVDIFCRGACWTPLDPIGLDSTKDDYQKALLNVKAAGMNMLRLSGTLIYEAPIFYDLCDELGILIWQDFMFANLDYPVENEEFCATVEAEVLEFVEQHGFRPCLAVLDGGSEVAQQASMMGRPEVDWVNPLFSELIPNILSRHCPLVPYIANTPLGGTLPFHTGHGVTHYYGVGAYLRPLSDVQLAKPKFATECLAFSNVPTETSLLQDFSSHETVAHHPKFKGGVPRDNGSGWDFADVSDHYLEVLYSLKARELRYHDPMRYLELSRLVSGELMAQTFGYMRTKSSGCAGALVWFLKDILPGAGWGVIDHRGSPKAPYFYMKRTLQPVAVSLVDCGLDGVEAHIFNDTSNSIRGQLKLQCFRDPSTELTSVTLDIEIEKHGHWCDNLERILGHFVDPNFAYRFGPPAVMAVYAQFSSDIPAPISAVACHFPLGLAGLSTSDLGLSARASRLSDGRYLLTVESRGLAHAVCLHIDGFEADDNFFVVAPHGSHTIYLEASSPNARCSGFIKAANCAKSARIVVEN